MRLTLLFICFAAFSIAQPPTDRYDTELFTDFVKTSDVQFSTDVPQPLPGGGFYEWLTGYPVNVNEYEFSYEDLKMHIYEPLGDTLSQRPLILIGFGGGFVAGSKDHWSIQLLCEELARHGYVTAAFDYRLGMNMFYEDLTARAVYRAVQDLRSAVRFFRADAATNNTYKIDPNQIFVGGHSAGAFAALHNVYMDQDSLRPISTFEWFQEGTPIPDQLGLDEVGDNQEYNGRANSVFSLAGALGFLSYIENDEDPHSISFHSSDDGTVPYDSGEPFGDISILVFGSELPIVYGSNQIHLRSDTVGLLHDFHPYTNRGHSVHENGTTSLYPEIVPEISHWFRDVELKPMYESILGDTLVCNDGLERTYRLTGDTAAITGVYFDWNIVGGTFVQNELSADSVVVVWDPASPNHSLSVTPYSKWDAKGDQYTVDISSTDFSQKMFLNNSSIWQDPSNWSSNILPNVCHDVIIADNITLDPIMIMEDVHINSLELGTSVVLNNNGALIDIFQKNNIQNEFAMDVRGTINNDGIINVQNILLGKEVIISELGKITNLDNSIIQLKVLD